MIRDGKLRLPLPLPFASGAKSLHDKLRKRRKTRMASSPFRQLDTDELGKWLLQDHCCAWIGGTETKLAVECKHTGGEIRQNALEVRSRCFDGVTVLFRFEVRF